MVVTTSDLIPGRDIDETIGLVIANAVRARNVGRDITALFKNLIGGRVGAYQQLLIESREEALAELEEKARQQGADAIVALRMSTSSIASGAAEVLVYGTAVKLV